MKKLSLLSMVLLGLFFSATSIAQTVKKETIKVWGNCGSCKKKI